MNQQSYVHIRLRRDTAQNWTNNNPILKIGEPGLETDTRKLKFGDGATAWNNLPYSGVDVNDNLLLENIDDRVANLIKAGSNISVSYNDNSNELIISATGLQLSGDYATLVNGKIPAIQLPSYVDDVLEFNNLASFPSSGEGDKIYVAKDSNKTYRWSGSAYVEISASPGSTDSVTEGSVNKYYTDARASAAAPVQSVAGKTGTVTLAKSDVGLGNVDNTSDANKPVSTAQQTALDLKAPIANPTFTGTVTVNNISVSVAGHTHTSSNISDSTSAGRALLTAADSAAQNLLLWEFLPQATLGSVSFTAKKGGHYINKAAPTIPTAGGFTILDPSDPSDGDYYVIWDQGGYFYSIGGVSYGGLDYQNTILFRVYRSGFFGGLGPAGAWETQIVNNNIIEKASLSSQSQKNAKILITTDTNKVYRWNGSSYVEINYASLVNGTVPSSQLPSYVDDVLEFANLAALPVSGETSKIYVTLDNNKVYRWGGSTYVEISASPGSTDAVPEGSVNKYYTDARASAAAPVQSVNGLTGAVTINTNNTGDITFSGVKIIGDGEDSGDGNGYGTIELVPDSDLYNNDQYLIVDPTAPNHIHLRAGGNIDESNAELIIGGEMAHLRVLDSDHTVKVMTSTEQSETVFTISGGGSNGYFFIFSPNPVPPVGSTFTVGDQVVTITSAVPLSTDPVTEVYYSPTNVMLEQEVSYTAVFSDPPKEWTFANDGNLSIPGNILLDNGTSVAVGSYDNNTGGQNGISLNCAVGYELNWQGGHLRSSQIGNPSTAQPLFVDSPIKFPGTGEDDMTVSASGLTFPDGTTLNSANISAFDIYVAELNGESGINSDDDLYSVLNSVDSVLSGKAATVHTHQIDDVIGLQAVLDTKLTYNSIIDGGSY